MADILFDNPPALSGTEETKLNQLYRYLFTLSEKLNQALMDISIEQMSPDTQEQIRNSAENNATREQNYNQLKSVIIRTADTLRKEIQDIERQTASYEGNLTEDIADVTNDILREKQYDGKIQGLEADDTKTAAFMRKISQSMFIGLVDEENGKFGIAIGDGITDWDEDGNAQINESAKLATFTMDRVSFWHGAEEIAYIEDGTVHFAKAEAKKCLKMGNHKWMVFDDNSIALVSG